MATQGFIEVKPRIGLFRGAGEHWQYVPFGGGRLTAVRAVPGAKLMDVAGPVEVFEIPLPAPPNANGTIRTWSDAATVARANNPALQGARFFAVKGKTTGAGKFRVGAYWLNVDVARVGSDVPVHVHLVSDPSGKTEYRSQRTDEQVRQMIQEANKVLEPQSGFRFDLEKIHRVTIGRDGGTKSFNGPVLHDRVPLSDVPNKNDQTQWITRKGVANAVNIFFMWNFVSTQKHGGIDKPLAVAIHDRFILMSNSYTNVEVGGTVIAHEFLHNCGYYHDEQNQESIMFPTPTRKNIGPAHRKAMHAWNEKPWSTLV